MLDQVAPTGAGAGGMTSSGAAVAQSVPAPRDPNTAVPPSHVNSNLPTSPAVAAAMAEAAAFDDRLDTNTTVIGPLNPEWLDKKVNECIF